MNSPDIRSFLFVVAKAEELTRESDGVVSQIRQGVEKTLIMGEVHGAMSAKKPATGNGRGSLNCINLEAGVTRAERVVNRF